MLQEINISSSKYNSKAFSLVELSIVIVIIGFLVAGISYGSNMIASAEIVKAIKDLRTTSMGVMQFREKYRFLPGDFNNSSGVISGARSGNGDWIITCNNNGDECWISLNQLSLSGFIQGSYNGTNQAIKFLKNELLVTTDTYVGGSIYGRKKSSAAIGHWSNVTVFQGFSIDTKIDDGKASSGDIYAFTSSPSVTTNLCVKQSDGVTDAGTSYNGIVEYDIKNPDKLCTMLMVAVY